MGEEGQRDTQKEKRQTLHLCKIWVMNSLAIFKAVNAVGLDFRSLIICKQQSKMHKQFKSPNISDLFFLVSKNRYWQNLCSYLAFGN